jgi:hypothetical protein
MKKRIACIGLILGALLLLLGGCSNIFEDFQPAGSTPQSQAQAPGQGTLKLSVNGSGARTLAPDMSEFTQYGILVSPVQSSSSDYSGTVGFQETVPAPFGDKEIYLDPGNWHIEIVAYTGEPPVASVYGEAEIALRSGESRGVNIMLNRAVEDDVTGIFEYNIKIPSTVVQRLDSTSKKRDPYGNVADPSNGLPFPDDEFSTVGKANYIYFSGAILRIIPDGYTDIAAPSYGYVILDLLYGDQSPGEYGNNNTIDPKRYAEGKIELPAGRYKMYLSLVSDRAIGDTGSTTGLSTEYTETGDYIGIFKEEVVYIYPNMTTKTPDLYTTFTTTDMDSQVFFEGHTHISQDTSATSYTATQVQVSRSYHPSHYYGESSSYLWTAPIANGEWNLYIPSQELAQGYSYASQGHLDIITDAVYFRFRMEDDSGNRVLYSPWQQYVTREIQGQIDLDLYATIETLTIVEPAGSTITVGMRDGHNDTIAERETHVYDVVRGVNFQNAGSYPYTHVQDVLIEVTPPAGKAIASFDARTAEYYGGGGYSFFPNISWRYADGEENDYTDPSYMSSSPSSIPTHSVQTNRRVVYAINNFDDYTGLDHTEDHETIPGSISTDLGTLAVEITARYFDFQGHVTMNPANMVGTPYIEVYDGGSNLIDRRQLTSTGGAGTYQWDFDPAYNLPVFHIMGGSSYLDYDIYDYDSSSPYVDFSNGASSAYDSEGVYFLFAFDSAGTTVFRTQPTRKYTAPELVNPILLGIGSTHLDVANVTQQFERETVASVRNGLDLNYATNIEEYYYFFADSNSAYTLEYEDWNNSTDLGMVDVSWLATNSGSLPTSIGLVGGYPSQAVYNPYGTSLSLVTVVVKDNWGSSANGYRLRIEEPVTYTVTSGTTELPDSIRQGTTKFYKFASAAQTLHYALFQGNVTVMAYYNGFSTPDTLQGDGSFNNSAFIPQNQTQGILAIRENNFASSATSSFQFKVATPTTIGLGIAASAPIEFNIRRGTSQYYRVDSLTPGANYFVAFRDLASGVPSINYADVSVRTIFSNNWNLVGNYTNGNNNGNSITLPAAPSAGWVILQVTEDNTPAANGNTFGIRLYPQ